MRMYKFLLVLLLTVAISQTLYADLQSASYKVEREQFSGGGGQTVSSAQYKVEEGIVAWTAKASLSSANYRSEGEIGFTHGNLSAPSIQSISPADKSRHYVGDGATFTVTAQDPDNSPLEYQLKMDNTVKIPFQPSNILSFKLVASDKGRHTLTFEVRDDGATVKQDQQAYFYRKPISAS